MTEKAVCTDLLTLQISVNFKSNHNRGLNVGGIAPIAGKVVSNPDRGMIELTDELYFKNTRTRGLLDTVVDKFGHEIHEGTLIDIGVNIEEIQNVHAHTNKPVIIFGSAARKVANIALELRNKFPIENDNIDLTVASSTSEIKNFKQSRSSDQILLSSENKPDEPEHLYHILSRDVVENEDNPLFNFLMFAPTALDAMCLVYTTIDNKEGFYFLDIYGGTLFYDLSPEYNPIIMKNNAFDIDVIGYRALTNIFRVAFFHTIDDREILTEDQISHFVARTKNTVNQVLEDWKSEKLEKNPELIASLSRRLAKQIAGEYHTPYNSRQVLEELGLYEFTLWLCDQQKDLLMVSIKEELIRKV